MNLTDEQKSVLAYSGNGSLRIIAGAGAGKTTTMTLFLKTAIDAGYYNEREACFITFTRLASQEIRNKLSQHIGKETSIRCGTFHKIMYLMLKEANVVLPDGIGLYDHSLERGVRFFLDQMVARNPALIALLQSIKCLVIDEFQDLDIDQFTFVKLFREIQPSLHVIAIGDLAQNIYRFRGTSNEFLRRLLQKEVAPELTSMSLSTNFRSNAAVLDCVNTVFAPEIADGHVLRLETGRCDLPAIRPRYYEYARNPSGGIGEYESLVADTLAPLIRDAKRTGKSVALIFPAVRCMSYEIIMMSLQKRLGTDVDFHRISKEDATTCVPEIPYDPRTADSPVQCATVHASKGLEWDIVALINISDDMYVGEAGETMDEGFIQEKTNLLYVGMTRAIEQLHVFANANRDGRNRILARCASLTHVFDVTRWGEDTFPPKTGRRPAPTGVTQIIQRLTQHPDLLARVQAATATIPAEFHEGVSLSLDDIYAAMKLRNREMAFGTFVDWKIKKAVAGPAELTRQCRLLEVLYNMRPHNWFHRDVRYNTPEQMNYVLTEFFERAGTMPTSSSLTDYITSVRILAGYFASKFFMAPEAYALFSDVERQVLATYKKEGWSLRDEYLLAQSYSLYAFKQHYEIMSVSAIEDSYCGLPAGFDEFAAVAVAPAVVCLNTVMAELGVDTSTSTYRVDVPVETESLLYGEIDIMADETIVEIKCGNWTGVSDLRGSGSCTNLLQLLAYVAIGRHGTLTLSCKCAVILNPLTGTWERYDISAWPEEQSREFLACLEELRERLAA